MSVGGFNLDDELSLAFFVLTWIFGTISAIIVPVIAFLIFKELRSKFVDVLKLLQHIAILLWYLAAIIDIILHLTTVVLSKFVYIIFLHFDWIILIYYAINQLSWYLLSIHLETYRQIAQDKSYKNWKAVVLRKEIVWFSLIILFYSFAIVWSVFLYLNSGTESNDSKSSRVYSTYYFIQLVVIEILFGLNEIRLYFKVTLTMKKTLNYYYLKTKNNLKRMAIVNTMFFFGVAWINIIYSIFNVNTIEFTGYSIESGYKEVQSNIIIYLIFLYILNWLRTVEFRVLFLWAAGSIHFMVLSYTYFNSKNIDFKEWILDVMLGYRIVNHYWECSLFIRWSIFYKESSRLSESVQDSCTESFVESEQDEINHDNNSGTDSGISKASLLLASMCKYETS